MQVVAKHLASIDTYSNLSKTFEKFLKYRNQNNII